MAPTLEQVKESSIVARVADMSPEEFEAECEKTWSGVDAVKQELYRQVAQGNLRPVQGWGMLSCAVGQAFGYPEFHGQASPSDSFIRSLLPSLVNGNS